MRDSEAQKREVVVLLRNDKEENEGYHLVKKSGNR